MNKEALISSLIEKGWFTYDSFIDPTHCQKLLDEVKALPLKMAKIGKGHLEHKAFDIRTDSIFWLTENQSEAQSQYLDKVNELMLLLNQELYFGLKQFEGHFARYEQDGFYKKHLDQFANNNERLITVITYLNSPRKGGELRLYKRDHPEEVEIDLLPTAGKFVCFLSNQIYHEVKPTEDERYSLTGWLRTTVP
ncbi:MAG: 2OG-Fe(II) oxygenase [Bacteriovorax sp.]|nr:2OG-Fe(II) oxygenase [Bacteriovorax sp.]